MANSTTHVAQVAASQAQKEVTANGLFDAASVAMFGGRRAEASYGLTWGYYGGPFAGSSVANGTLALTVGRTNYIVASRQNGAISVSTDGANWVDVTNYARLYKVEVGAVTVSSYRDYRFGRFGTVGAHFGGATPLDQVEYRIHVGSDITTTITAGTGKAYWRVPQAMLLTGIRASLATASTSGAVTVDVNDTTYTILGTKLTLDQDEKSSVTAATAHALVADGPALADDAELTVDIDGAGTGAAGLFITLIGLRGAQDPAADLLVSHLALEGANNGTTFTDATGRAWSYTAVVTSTAQSMASVYSTFAASSGLFNGTSSVLYTTDVSSAFNLATARWYLDFWVRFTSLANSPYLWQVGFNSSNRAAIYQTGNNLRFGTNAGGTFTDRIAGATALSTGTWYHVALSYDLATFRLFIDGAVEGTSTTTTIANSDAQYAYLGYHNLGGSSSNALSGHIQRFRMYRGWAGRTAAFTRPMRPAPAN